MLSSMSSTRICTWPGRMTPVVAISNLLTRCWVSRGGRLQCEERLVFQVGRQYPLCWGSLSAYPIFGAAYRTDREAAQTGYFVESPVSMIRPSVGWKRKSRDGEPKAGNHQKSKGGRLARLAPWRRDDELRDCPQFRGRGFPLHQLRPFGNHCRCRLPPGRECAHRLPGRRLRDLQVLRGNGAIRHGGLHRRRPERVGSSRRLRADLPDAPEERLRGAGTGVLGGLQYQGGGLYDPHPRSPPLIGQHLFPGAGG